MFPSNPSGQPSSSPFGAQPAFGGTSTPAFGSNSSPFGAFGQPSSSRFGAQPTFGGTTTPAVGGTSTPASGSNSSPFGAFGQPSSSSFGAQPAFGGTSTPAFGGTSTPASGSNSSPFGAFGQPSSSRFGAQAEVGGTSTPAFGGTSTPAFGSNSSPFGAFGQPSPSCFGAQPAFGGTSTPAFGGTSTPASGYNSSPFGAFGQPSSSRFGAQSAFGGTPTPAFGGTSTPAFCSNSSPFGAFGQSSSRPFGAQPAFGGTSTPAFGGTSTPAFGSNSSPFGVQSTTPTFGGQHGGSRVAPYTTTNETDSSSSISGQRKMPEKILSISAMPQYKEKSHEELRWEDYQSGEKGGLNLSSQQPAESSPFGSNFDQTQPAFGSQPFGATSQSAFGSTSTPDFSSTLTPPFGATSTPAFCTTSTPAFGASTTPAFGASSTPDFGNSSAPSYGLGSIPAFGQSASAFSAASTPAFGNSPSFESISPFGAQSTPAFGASSAPSFGSGSTPAFGSQPFGATRQSAFGSTSAPAFGSISTPVVGATSMPAFGTASTPAFGASSTPAFGASSSPALGNSSAPSYGFGSIPAFGQSAAAFGAQISAFESSPFGSNFGQTQPTFHSQPFGATSQSAVASSGCGAASTPACGQTIFGQPAQQNMTVMVPQPVSNPFGTLPPMPQMSIGQSAGSAPSIQYGISSLPVIKKPTKVRTTSLLAPRHITPKSRICMHSRGYKPKKNGSKVVSFFSDGEEALCTPRADAMFFLPRENPRALFIRQPDQSSPSVVLKPAVNMKEMALPINDHDAKENCPGDLVKSSFRQNGSSEEHSHRGNGYISFSGHSASEVAIVYKYGEDIVALMPKLRNSDYYTEPTIQELAAKERALPGYCSRVKDFVVGRKGYGYVKFFGETDVRQLDLDSIIQFKECELSVYNKKSKKPFPGQGLDKPAEITLLNVQCVDKKTGQHCTEGVKVDKLEKRLKRKTEQEGAEFMSYNAIKGEWKFCVKYFSKKIRLGGVEDANIQSNLLSSKLVAASIELSSRQNGSREEHGADIEALMPKLRHSDY